MKIPIRVPYLDILAIKLDCTYEPIGDTIEPRKSELHLKWEFMKVDDMEKYYRYV